MKEDFVYSDAWILLAIIYSGRRQGVSADRSTISQAADYINHAIPTRDEINGALTRLQRAGWVEEDNGNYRASASALEAYARTTTPWRDVRKEFEDMRRLLNV